MTTFTIIGADPGPYTGLVRLTWVDGRLAETRVTQADPETAEDILYGWPTAIALAIEDYVISQRAGKNSDPRANEVTRQALYVLENDARSIGLKVIKRKAGDVKPWASDERLKKAGLYFQSSMRHARDAARPALYASTKDYGMPDPLSRNWKK